MVIHKQCHTTSASELGIKCCILVGPSRLYFPSAFEVDQIAMRLRVRGPSGQSVLTIASDSTVQELQQAISEKTGIAEFDIKVGYPPKSLVLDLSRSLQLSDLGIPLDGEQLIISHRNPPPATQDVALPSQEPNADSTNSESRSLSTANKPIGRRASVDDPPELPLATHDSTLIVRIMPDDNSCLFRAFNTAFFGPALDNMQELRSIIAQTIQADPSKYPPIVLEKSTDDYCRWIQSANSWGGAIELEVLSRHFDIEINSIDVQTLRVDRFNEGTQKRCILVYSGIHYDVIALSPSDPPYQKAYAPPEFDTLVFDADDSLILDKAVDLCRILQERHYYTDTAGFSVKCNVCGGVFTGEKGATEHAKQTGHYDFGEAG